MTETWAEITGRSLASAATPPSTCSETRWGNELPPRPKATRAHRQAIAELGLRFKPANHVDLEEHALRLELLAVDCADLAPGLLRQACDTVARDARFLPSAAELRAAAKFILEERQRVQRKAGFTVNGDGEIIDRPQDAQIGDPGDNSERCIQRNRQLMREGAMYRVFPVGAHNAGRVQVVDDGAIAPTHICNGDGTFRNRLGHQSGLWPR